MRNLSLLGIFFSLTVFAFPASEKDLKKGLENISSFMQLKKEHAGQIYIAEIFDKYGVAEFAECEESHIYSRSGSVMKVTFQNDQKDITAAYYFSTPGNPSQLTMCENLTDDEDNQFGEGGLDE